jgi:hypothetical protein
MTPNEIHLPSQSKLPCEPDRSFIFFVESKKRKDVWLTDIMLTTKQRLR